MSRLDDLYEAVLALAPQSDRRSVEKMGIREAEYALEKLGHRRDLEKISYQPSTDMVTYLSRGAKSWSGFPVNRA